MESHNPFPDVSGLWLGSAQRLLVMCCCLESPWLIVGVEVGLPVGIQRHYPFESWHRLLCLDVGLGRTKHAGPMRDFYCFCHKSGVWKLAIDLLEGLEGKAELLEC